jgi:hypothetical protein
MRGEIARLIDLKNPEVPVPEPTRRFGERVPAAQMVQDRLGQNHGAEVVAAPITTQSLLPVDVLVFLGIQFPIADQLVPQDFVLIEFL